MPRSARLVLIALASLLAVGAGGCADSQPFEGTMGHRRHQRERRCG